MPQTHLANALRSLWTASDAAPRRRTLARLAQHERQLESWWKYELGAHLWDHASHFGPSTYVWLESHDRADITIATGVQTSKRFAIAPDASVCIPIELKTTGTWWGSTPSVVDKALSEAGKKKLSQDMADLRRRRLSKPFGAVGLLVTHLGQASDEVLALYLNHARVLGARHELELLIDEAIELPIEDGQPAVAHQIFWTAGAATDTQVEDEQESDPSPAHVHDVITLRQHNWMQAKGHPTDERRGWAQQLEHNLFEPMDPVTRSEFEAGRGNELQGKLTAPWSSSALAVNVFQFWRNRDKTILARGLGRADISSIRFEQCHPTGNQGGPANLDVEIVSANAPILAIESKLREPFGQHAPLKPSYLAKAALWDKLPRCHELAIACDRNPGAFERLDVAQLLKHLLGLTRKYGTNFELLYLWYDPTNQLAEGERAAVRQHQLELERFSTAVTPEVRFRQMSYQALFNQLRNADAMYVDYLRTRYFH